MYITHEPDDKDAWTCICGNTPPDDGFYPCDENGNELEPDIDGPWDGVRYVCNACGRIIDQNTLEIIGFRPDADLTQDEKTAILADLDIGRSSVQRILNGRKKR